MRLYCPRMQRMFVVLLAAVAVFAAGCSPRDDDGSRPDDAENIDSCERFPNLCELSDKDLQIRVGGALETAGTYRITAVQDNLVLSRWGGSDGGSVSVDVKAGTAVADLRRTGDGQYAVVLSGDTYFKRETCRNWTRVQDGKDVLAPFILTPDEISRSRVLETVSHGASSAILLRVDLAGVGEVMLELDSESGRPLKLWSETLRNNGRRLEWRFDQWGDPVPPPNVSADRVGGPGGNPC